MAHRPIISSATGKAAWDVATSVGAVAAGATNMTIACPACVTGATIAADQCGNGGRTSRSTGSAHSA